MQKPRLYDLQLHKKVNGVWVHFSTLIWNSPYPLCRGMKLQYEMHKAHFEFYKIKLNK